METVITPKRSLTFNIKELLKYKELFYFFVMRDLSTRYSHVLVGIIWAMLRPLLTVLVYTAILGNIHQIKTVNIPYPLFAFVGILFWTYFSSALSRISASLVTHHQLITKVYFPRFLLPLSSGVVGWVDFLFAFTGFAILLLFFRVDFSMLGFLLILPFLLIAHLTALSLGLFFSFFTVKYRDTKEILPFLTSLLFFLTPVVYSVRIIPPKYHSYLYINPLVGIIETTRSILFHQAQIPWYGLLVSMVSCFVLFVLSMIYFKTNEKELADII